MTHTLLLDMDGPLADFDRHFYRRCSERGYTFDVDGPEYQQHRYFTEHLPNPSERKQARRMVDTAGWFAELPVVPGAQQGVLDLLNAGVEVWVCTKPLEVNPTCHSDKANWILRHFPPLHDRLIIAPDKSMIAGDVLLDDAPKHEWLDHAPWRPVIFAAPFNADQYPGCRRWTWGDPLDDLLAPARSENP